MNIWLVTIGEPLPLGISKDDRPHRTGQFARFLAADGHEVIWWTSTFDHFRKKHHFSEDNAIQVGPGLELRVLRGCGYSRNISISRFRDHVQIARKFAAAAAESARPDVIISALPTVELCLACVEYGEREGIPVVLDMRDMWPDIFVDAIPGLFRRIGRLALSSLYRQAQQACGQATALIGITDEFVAWGLNRGRRRRGPLDRAFPMAYEATVPPADRLAAAERFWDDHGIHKNEPGLIVCYFGSVGVQLDLTHLIDAARLLNQRGLPIRFVVCGRGERLEEYRQLAKGVPNVLLPGWVDGAQIWSLMRRSSTGVDPLPDRYDFLATINNKAVEYLSAGLPVVSSPQGGVLYEMLRSERCGLSYSTGSAEGLAGTLQYLHSNPEALVAMSARAQAVFDGGFAADAIYARMSEYLGEVISTKRVCATPSVQ